MKQILQKTKENIKVNYYKYSSKKKHPKMLKKWYDFYTNEDLDFDNLKNFNQFIQYLKIYDNTDLKGTLVDKYEMRQFVIDNIGEQYLPKLYGVYNSFDEIDFDKLPDKFVLKCNHGCGMNVVVKDKTTINKNELKKKFKEWLKINYAYRPGLEMQYKNIKPRIVCEEYLGDNLVDLQAWCTKGNILFLSYIKSPHGENKKISYDENWNKLDFVTSLPKLESEVSRPKKLDEILEISKRISKDMEFLRFDFYVQENGDVKISEFTFTPASGLVHWYPKETNELIYNKIVELNK